MGLQIKSIDKKLFSTFSEIDYLKKEDLDKCIGVFNTFKTIGIIYNNNFDEDVWQVTDEYQKMSFDFVLDEISIKNSKVFSSFTSRDLTNYLKMHVIQLFGNYVIMSIQNFLRELKTVIKEYDGRRINTSLKLQKSNMVYNFCEQLNLNETREVNRLFIELDLASERTEYKKGINRRSLSTFQSYFKFDELLDTFWNDNLDDKQRTFYYPLYLWWKVTTILPLRPREFLLIPRDCFRDTQNDNLMTFRRTKLKGGHEDVGYSINNDYEFHSYDVGPVLANEIKDYLRFTEDLQDNSLSTLFRADDHYEYFGKSKRYDSRFFTYANMRYCLRRFYHDVLFNEYGYRIISTLESETNDDETEYYSLDVNDIEYINLGDTRHIAMINIVASGSTPSTAMMLAGHANIDISSHYFSNISTLVECKTYHNYKNSIEPNKGNYEIGVNNANTFSMSAKYVQLEGTGRCYSEQFINGEFSDCLKVASNTGEIGNCEDCDFFRDGNYRIFFNDKKIYTDKIEDDCKFLAEQFNKYRKRKGYEEDIKRAILKLQNSVHSYEKYFNQRLMNGENNA